MGAAHQRDAEHWDVVLAACIRREVEAAEVEFTAYLAWVDALVAHHTVLGELQRARRESRAALKG